MRYVCDRCQAREVTAVNEVTPNRIPRPEGWMALWIGSTTNPPSHLCPGCNAIFSKMMEAGHAEPQGPQQN